MQRVREHQRQGSWLLNMKPEPREISLKTQGTANLALFKDFFFLIPLDINFTCYIHL